MVFKQSFTDREGVTGIGFSPDGKCLVTGSYEGEVRVWEIASGKPIRLLTGHRGWVFSTFFSPDGAYVVSSGQDATARLWDVQTGQEVRRFTGHSNEIRNVTFSPDGKYILTASNDGTARLWLTNLDDTIRAVCALLTRDLTQEERVQFDITDQGLTCPVQ
jgi:WD40 repeat protein